MNKKYFSSMTELTGGTPLLEMANLQKKLQLGSRILAKLEYFNPTGSVKDRAALSMIRAAEEDGTLRPGGVIMEPTSGNTGIALAAMGASLGYRVILAMPDSMSRERGEMMAAYGAELELTPAARGMSGAIDRANELQKQISGSIIAGQFTNPANVRAHEMGTGPEIYADTDGNADIFVAGVGTGGTITGVGRYLKGKNPRTRIVAVEPADSPVLSRGKTGPHKIQGIGAGFVPPLLDLSLVDEIMTSTTEEAFDAARMLVAHEGIMAGISSGAALSAAIRLAQRPENTGKTIVALLPDSGDRYLSTGLFSQKD